MNSRKVYIVFLVNLFSLNILGEDPKPFKFPRPIEKSDKQVPIIFHEKYDISVMGIENFHPFDSKKYGKVFNHLSRSLNLKKKQFYKPSKLKDKELKLMHSKDYLKSLEKSATIAQIAEIPALKYVPNFILQNEVLTSMKYATSGTILGCDLAIEHGWAINLSGGYHHAKANSGEGFCVFADIPLAVYKVLEKHPEFKVLVIDLDAHQGNGCESIFENDERVAYFDVYNGEIYPNDTDAKEFIKFDFPVQSFIKDKEYLELIKKQIPEAINSFKPNLIIYNAGTDIFKEDPLGKMAVSENGIIKRDSFVFETALENNIPILMTLSGGYSPKSASIIGKSLENIIKKNKLLTPSPIA